MSTVITRHRFWLPFVGLSIAFGLLCSAAGAITLPENPPPLPSNPEQWINSSPLTYEQLAGKGVVFWYFEETCPKCRKAWPKLMEEVAKFADQPVLFIAVNSGCERSEIAKYVEELQLSWPVLVDPDRSFEAASGEVDISLDRIMDVRMVKPDQSYMWGWWNDIPMTVEHATQGAAWKFNYEKVPAEMHFAARRLEFGDLLPAAPAIQSGLISESQEVRKTAAYMQSYIHKLMQASIDKHVSMAPAEDAWIRYSVLNRTAQNFAPHALPTKEAAELEKLSADPAVITELRAAKALAAAGELASKRDKASSKKAVTLLERIIKNYPETYAAKQAKEILNKSGMTPAEPSAE